MTRKVIQKLKAAARRANRQIRNSGSKLNKLLARILQVIGGYTIKLFAAFCILQITFYMVKMAGITILPDLYTLTISAAGVIVAFFAANNKKK